MLGEYHFIDAARKVVGVGSVGTRCYVIVMQGRDGNDPLVLQVKEAGRSVLEDHLNPSAYRNQGRRVVAGQRLLQSVSDVFLGWSSDGNHYFYWRQLRDMKGSIDITAMDPDGFALYAGLCGRALAIGHANSGARIRIAGYLGSSEAFDTAVADFALTYADQTLKDYRTFTTAITDTPDHP